MAFYCFLNAYQLHYNSSSRFQGLYLMICYSLSLICLFKKVFPDPNTLNTWSKYLHCLKKTCSTSTHCCSAGTAVNMSAISYDTAAISLNMPSLPPATPVKKTYMATKNTCSTSTPVRSTNKNGQPLPVAHFCILSFIEIIAVAALLPFCSCFCRLLNGSALPVRLRLPS